MALKIRSIPLLTGETAERFVREAEETEHCPHKKNLRMSFEDVEKILARSDSASSDDTQNNDNNVLGNIIKTVRKDKGLTQENLGRLVGLRKTNISKMENGITNVSVEDVSILLEAMGEKLDASVIGYTQSSEKTRRQIYFIVVAVCWFAEAKNISTKEAYDYLLKYQGISFLEENYEYEQTMPKETIVDDLTQICNNPMSEYF